MDTEPADRGILPAVRARSPRPGTLADARLDDAVQQLRAASTPLLQVLDPETQTAIRGDESA